MESVCVSYVHPGETSGRFMQSLVSLLIKDSMRKPVVYKGRTKPGTGPRIACGVGSYIQIESGPRIATNRNLVVERFLDLTSQEWLWMLDADMTFETDILDKLFEAADPVERPIIGGLYFGGGRSGRVFPIMYKIQDPKEHEGNSIAQITEWPEGAVVRVDAIGAGCLLMHRSALMQMRLAYPKPHQWFMESVYAGMEFGEDWTFCLRAAKINIPIYCHTGVDLGHCKTFEIRRENYAFPSSDKLAHPLQDLPHRHTPNIVRLGEKNPDGSVKQGVVEGYQALTRIL